jgi:hypothetical protein
MVDPLRPKKYREQHHERGDRNRRPGDARLDIAADDEDLSVKTRTCFDLAKINIIGITRGKCFHLKKRVPVTVASASLGCKDDVEQGAGMVFNLGTASR